MKAQQETPLAEVALEIPTVFAAETQMQAAYVRFHQQLAVLPEEARQYGSYLISKLLPPQWSLEWYLPQWLGEDLHIGDAQTAALVLGNVYGLCHVALCDILIDDSQWTRPVAPEIILNSALAHWWLALYVDYVGGDAWFWERFGVIMQQWWQTMAASNRYPPLSFHGHVHRNWHELSYRASPLKVCCVAACRLGGQEDRWPHLEATLDHLHVARVLIDHVQDWLEDSEAGRYNALVHYASGASDGVAPSTGHAMQAVYEELWFGRRALPYFEIAAEHMTIAMQRAEQTGCSALQHTIAIEQAQYAHYRKELVAAAEHFLRQATETVFAGSSA